MPYRSLVFYDDDETKSNSSQYMSQGSYIKRCEVPSEEIPALRGLKYTSEGGVQTLDAYDVSYRFSSEFRLNIVDDYYVLVSSSSGFPGFFLKIPLNGTDPRDSFFCYLFAYITAQRFTYGYTLASVLNSVVSYTIAYVKTGHVSLGDTSDAVCKSSELSYTEKKEALTDPANDAYVEELSKIAYMVSHMFYLVSGLCCQWEYNHQDATNGTALNLIELLSGHS